MKYLLFMETIQGHGYFPEVDSNLLFIDVLVIKSFGIKMASFAEFH